MSIASFAAFFILSVIGAYWHYRKVRTTGRHDGTLFDYLFADHPAKTGTVFVALLVSSWTAATTGVAAYIDPALLWQMLQHGKLHEVSIAIGAAAVQSGYQFDSWLNKGGSER